ncbi:class I SAM-dependent methyltransferase [Jatrophihabitans telluris]|uniref:Class I SAM-dependent methyltransferase n=1 Tax=Jatrophihabitans telluris TaxID=2038343 RepID=A0ABY4QWE5_9ACTN|nr:class I SAM-dependent methyltransferase [Jatrophihabitans telluris]UQX87136.1 class I SAM-dependent methyltransferase [Jatrophihabitans telluris]
MPDTSSEPAGPAFTATMAVAESIGGWLTAAQARVLWDEAATLPARSRIVEIGSHQGRSTVVLARAAPESTLVAIDPFIAGALFGGAATKDKFAANIDRAGVAGRIELREAKSTDLRPTWTEPIDLLYIDGKHDYWTLSDDLRWAEFVRPGGIVLIHDAFSSIGVTLGLLRHVLFGSRLRYLDRQTSLARFAVEPPQLRDRARLMGQLPWWVRNVVIKVGLRAARPFGNTTPDPY